MAASNWVLIWITDPHEGNDLRRTFSVQAADSEEDALDSLFTAAWETLDDKWDENPRRDSLLREFLQIHRGFRSDSESCGGCLHLEFGRDMV